MSMLIDCFELLFRHQGSYSLVKFPLVEDRMSVSDDVDRIVCGKGL